MIIIESSVLCAESFGTTATTHSTIKLAINPALLESSFIRPVGCIDEAPMIYQDLTLIGRSRCEPHWSVLGSFFVDEMKVGTDA